MEERFYYEILTASTRQDMTFTYHSDQKLAPGTFVKVPFKENLVDGLVLSKSSKPETFETRAIAQSGHLPSLNEEQMALFSWLCRYGFCTRLQALEVLVPPFLRLTNLKEPVEKEEAFIRIKKNHDPLSEKQAAALKELESVMSLSEANKRIKRYMVSKLLEKGAIEKFMAKKGAERSHEETQISLKKEEWPELNMDQKHALNNILQSDKTVSLLYGVTGSGKTEVFFHLIDSILAEGKQVLLMVPEVSLVSSLARRLQERFGNSFGIYHGSLSASSKRELYLKVRSGELRLVLGTRSSVFLPFKNLGMIILDEEHDASYQSSALPAYHARDAAIFRMERLKGKVVLASATPSLETYSRAYKGNYELSTLLFKAFPSVLHIRFVDMSKENSYMGLSTSLIRAMEQTLLKGEKVMLLLNRRGYLPVVRCASCHETLLCPECGIALSYHKEDGALHCHLCGNRYPMPSVCPSCKQNKWSRTGFGTERLEETLRELFPERKVLRMDRDSTRKKGSHDRILDEFAAEGDILLGTQMIAKGHDIHDVTLVGILSMDSSLARPDFRASERTYQLLEQAAGRSGRGLRSGQALVQTYNPDHYISKLVKQGDFAAFFSREMKYRHMMHYPPYSFMAVVIVSGGKEEQLYKRADFLQKQAGTLDLELFGPVEISMRQKQQRLRLLARDKNEQALVDKLWKLKEDYENTYRSPLWIALNPVQIEE